MKALSILGLLALMASTAQAKSSTADLNGVWNGVWSIAERVCTDGLPANDRFQLGRDKLEFTINGSAMKLDMIIENEVYSRAGTVAATKNLITTSSDSGRVETQGYVLSKNDELVLVSAGFGQRGTCNEGQALLTIFKRK